LQGEGNVGEARGAARRTPSPSNTQVTQYPNNQATKGAAWDGVLATFYFALLTFIIDVRAMDGEDVLLFYSQFILNI
jgi:hypothetical protein